MYRKLYLLGATKVTLGPYGLNKTEHDWFCAPGCLNKNESWIVCEIVCILLNYGEYCHKYDPKVARVMTSQIQTLILLMPELVLAAEITCEFLN